MKRPLRVRYFLWLASLVVAYFCIHTVLLFAYNQHEIHSEGRDAGDEFDEFLIITGIGAAMIPFMMLLAWGISRRLLVPLESITETAQRISAGRFNDRIDTRSAEGEIAVLANTINQAFDRYHGAVERLKHFASNASHQLRTPLTAMRSVGEVALQKVREPEEYRETIGSMLEEVQRLSRTIEQMLLLARMESTDMNGQKGICDVVAMVSQILELRLPHLEAKKLAAKVNAPAAVSVLANGSLLEQAVANLIDNAIRHTPERGRIDIAIAAQNGEAFVSVKDSGPGIPEAYQSKLFERFSRGTSDDEGVGLGLAIAAEVMRVHGGSIEVESAAGKGAKFTIRLPSA